MADGFLRFIGVININSPHQILGAKENINDRYTGIEPPNELPTGGIVGKARPINTVHIRDKSLVCEADKPWFFGEYGFMLDSAEPCDLKPCKGALGFFDPDYNSKYAEPKPKKVKEQPKDLFS